MRTMLAVTPLAATHISTNLVLILLPLLVIEVGLVMYSLMDLFRHERQVVGDNKLVWALVILVIGTIGPILYLLVGRKQS